MSRMCFDRPHHLLGYWTLWPSDLGFPYQRLFASNLLVFRLAVPDVNCGKFVYGEKNTPREKLYENLERLLTAVPGVDSVAFTARMHRVSGSRAANCHRPAVKQLLAQLQPRLKENNASQLPLRGGIQRWPVIIGNPETWSGTEPDKRSSTSGKESPKWRKQRGCAK